MVLSSLYFYWYDYTKYQQLLQGKFEKNVLATWASLSPRERWQPQAAGECKTRCRPKEKTPEAPPFRASSGA
jgi:hypothetical protein